MSAGRIATYKNRQNGSLVNADSLPRIAVTRNDTIATVASGTMTALGGGLYTFSWTETVYGLAYTYTVSAVNLSISASFSNDNIAGTPTPSNPPGTIVGGGKVTDGGGNALGGIPIEALPVNPVPAGAGNQIAYDVPLEATSASDGTYTLTLLQNANYKIRGAGGSWTTFATGTVDMPLPQILIQTKEAACE